MGSVDVAVALARDGHGRPGRDGALERDGRAALVARRKRRPGTACRGSSRPRTSCRSAPGPSPQTTSAARPLRATTSEPSAPVERHHLRAAVGDELERLGLRRAEVALAVEVARERRTPDPEPDRDAGGRGRGRAERRRDPAAAGPERDDLRLAARTLEDPAAQIAPAAPALRPPRRATRLSPGAPPARACSGRSRRGAARTRPAPRRRARRARRERRGRGCRSRWAWALAPASVSGRAFVIRRRLRFGSEVVRRQAERAQRVPDAEGEARRRRAQARGAPSAAGVEPGAEAGREQRHRDAGEGREQRRARSRR